MKDYRILVPLDGSPLSKHTTESLIAQKEHFTVPLTLLHVLDISLLASRGFPEITFDQFRQRARDEARQFIADRKSEFAAVGMAVQTLLKEGDARETICATADSGDYDLLAVGRYADGELRTLLYGQMVNYLIHHVKCPVLIV